MNITSDVYRISLAVASVSAILLINGGIFLGGLATARSVAIASDQWIDEINEIAAQTNACIDIVHDEQRMIADCTERLNDSLEQPKVSDALHRCMQSLNTSMTLVDKAQVACESHQQMFDDDLDKFVEDTETLKECGQNVLRQSALHLAMVDHLNQVGLDNLTLEADGLEWDGESQLLMNNCAYAGPDDDCQQMAMQVTIFDNGAFMLGEPEPLEQ